MSTFFPYKPQHRWIQDPHRNNKLTIIVSGILSVYLVVLLVILLTTLSKDEFTALGLPALVGVLTLGIAVVNLAAFSRVVQQADLELTHQKVILHLTRRWNLSIDLSDLSTARIRKYAVPKTWIFGIAVGHMMDVYFISSPKLPWYFQFVGRFGFAYSNFRGRGFLITSWHENYAEFLDRIIEFDSEPNATILKAT